MPKNSLFISILFLLVLVISHKTTAKPAHQLKYALAPTVGSTSSVVKYLTKYGYNPCEDKNKLKMVNGKSVACQSNLETMLKDFQRRYKLTVTGKLDQKTLQLMNTPRCGIKDHPLAFRTMIPWSKKSFTWKLANHNLPSFGETKTRHELRESFNDWVRYAPISFREVSQNEKADFDLAFIGNTDGGDFDGPGGTLAYAYFPTVGKIRFDMSEPWTQKYDTNGINLRLVGTHEIGHALGLDHSDDQSSIMTPYYQLMQPEDLLPKDDRDGIQALYGTKDTPTHDHPKWDGYFKFKNAHTGLMMDVNGGSVDNSAAVIQFHDNGGDWQKWRVKYAGNGQYTITAKHSQLLLDSAGWSNADGTPLLQYIANGGNNQKWQIVQVPGETNVVKLINMHARNKLVSVPYASKEAGVQLHMWSDLGNRDQTWMMIPI